ncbi:MAG: ABC transporter ATP-binding protein [Albidovulum sp.]|nr:ABC transporter ATP-binding protein [Albidovulum sp.]MDE0305166.1 ABC transporter ATP-binding protein [Albidovulum sp.]MDE0530245.1 ABC transporter ATP-binding protein [Albidovulum sp.]
MTAPGKDRERHDEASVRLGAVGLSKAYGSVQANRNVSLAVKPQEIHAIVGENGAGKSTLMRLLQGIEQPDAGEIIVDDVPCRISSPRQAFVSGIGMIHQEFMLAPELTLLENLVLGDEPVTGPLARIDWNAARESGDAHAAQAGIEVDWDRKAGTTPVHIQQYVEIIRLLRRGTRVLIMDEPTSVLAPKQVEDLFDLLRKLRDAGTTVLFISHKLKEVMALADRVTVMRRGEVTFSSGVNETAISEVAHHVIGGLDLEQQDPTTGEVSSRKADERVLEVASLRAPAIERSHPLKGIEMFVGAGEIVGLAGVSGNGQSELVECLVGLRKPSSGQIFLEGRDITYATNRQRRDAGLGYVSADRRHEGLALDASIEINSIAGSQRRKPIRRGKIVDLGAMRRTAAERLSKLDVRFGSLRDAVRSLSGGNQQRTVFARETATDPTLLVVSQPTRGVDLRGIAAIHAILHSIRAKGASILLVSEELEEIIDLSDRVYVIADGRIVGETSGDIADVATVGQMMLTGTAQDG